jgi:hypothetical protein
MALSTNKHKERKYSLVDGRGGLGCATLQRLIDLRSRSFGLVLTSQWTTRAPFGRRRRRCLHDSHLGLILATTRAATATLLHHNTTI